MSTTPEKGTLVRLRVDAFSGNRLICPAGAHVVADGPSHNACYPVRVIHVEGAHSGAFAVRAEEIEEVQK